MPILQPNIMPSLGIPSQVVALPKQKRNRMNQADFYQQPQSQPLQQQQQVNPMQAVDSQYQPPEQSFASEPISGDYIKAQLASYQQRQAVPQLTPGSRVRPVDESIVEPANFQSFYDRLGMTEDLGKTMLGAASAKKRAAENKRLMDVFNQQVQSPGSVALKGGKTASGGQAFGQVPSNPRANFAFAQQVAPKYGWGADEMGAWYTLGMKESGWNNNAQNPTSTAYGIGQFLNSTWAGVGIGKTNDPATQVEAMARYIKNRYGSPSRALAFHLSHNWY